MVDATCPIPRFQRLRKVLVANGRLGGHFAEQQGTVIWCDAPCFDRRTGRWSEWIYSVSLPDLGCCQAFLESDLQPTGGFETEQSLLASRYEISFDTVLEGDEHEVAEGSYRLPGRSWQVFWVEHRDVPKIRHSFGTWRSGIMGIEFAFPRAIPINRDRITSAMSEVFGADSWAVVDGRIRSI